MGRCASCCLLAPDLDVKIKKYTNALVMLKINSCLESKQEFIFTSVIMQAKVGEWFISKLYKELNTNQ